MVEPGVITDWAAFVRACIRDHAAAGLDPDLSTPSAIAKFQGQLAGTAHAAPFTRAVLAILAGGAVADHIALEQVAFDALPDGAAAAARVARGWRGGPVDGRIGLLLLRAMRSDARDPELLAVLEEEVALGGDRAVDALTDMAPFHTPWVAAQLTRVPELFEPGNRSLAYVLAATHDAGIPVLVAAIAAAGGRFVEGFLAQLGAAPTSLGVRYWPHLAGDPAFARRG